MLRAAAAAAGAPRRRRRRRRRPCVSRGALCFLTTSASRPWRGGWAEVVGGLSKGTRIGTGEGEEDSPPHPKILTARLRDKRVRHRARGIPGGDSTKTAALLSMFYRTDDISGRKRKKKLSPPKEVVSPGRWLEVGMIIIIERIVCPAIRYAVSSNAWGDTSVSPKNH